MSRFTDACDALRGGVDLELAEVEERQRAVIDALPRATRSELATAAGELIEFVEHPDPRVAGLIAITLGALVETGLSPERVGAPIVRRTKQELLHARTFYEALVREGERHQECDDDADEDAFYGPNYIVAGETVRAIAEEVPRNARAYAALDTLCLPTIACMTHSSGVRAAARIDEALVEAARPLRRDLGKWLYKLLVGDAKAEWIVLHATERKGFVVRAVEINDNWVIQPLLAAALLDVREGGLFGLGARQVGLEGGLTGTPPPSELIECLRGHGPQSVEVSARGLWEAYTWPAVQPGGHLSKDLIAHAIWNEGIPLDIPKLDGKRVIVLGPAVFQRSWNAERSYCGLGSTIEHVRTLSRDEVDQWLRRCAFESMH